MFAVVPEARQRRLGKSTESSGGGTPVRAPNDAQRLRSERFRLQRHVWKLLPDWHRLTVCHTVSAEYRFSPTAAPERRSIEIRHRVREDGTHSCHYGGLFRCASVWVCPVCAPAIAERRAAEITQARDAWAAEGGEVVMVTFTFRHARSESLRDNVEGLRKARERLRGRKVFRALRSSLGMVGHISGLEVTYGRNGWHPHLHEYWFVQAGAELDQIKAELAEAWADCCEKQGLGRPTVARGVVVTRVESESADHYAVQGADLHATLRELTGSHTKRARASDSITMWEALYYSAAGNKRCGALFAEYAEVLQGRASLFWSQGLKARFLIGEASDETLADQDDTAGRVLCHVHSWHLVTRFRAQADLLAVAEASGVAGVERFLASLHQRADLDLRQYLRWRFGPPEQ